MRQLVINDYMSSRIKEKEKNVRPLSFLLLASVTTPHHRFSILSSIEYDQTLVEDFLSISLSLADYVISTYLDDIFLYHFSRRRELNSSSVMFGPSFFFC